MCNSRARGGVRNSHGISIATYVSTVKIRTATDWSSSNHLGDRGVKGLSVEGPIVGAWAAGKRIGDQ